MKNNELFLYFFEVISYSNNEYKKYEVLDAVKKITADNVAARFF